MIVSESRSEHVLTQLAQQKELQQVVLQRDKRSRPVPNLQMKVITVSPTTSVTNAIKSYWMEPLSTTPDPVVKKVRTHCITYITLHQLPVLTV